MRHTELYYAYKALDKHLERELIAAVKAHGGEYIFIHLNEDENEVLDGDENINAPVVLAAYKYTEEYKPFKISRLVVETHLESDTLVAYGWLHDPGWPDENLVDSFAHGALDMLIDAIPPTEKVQDVTIPLGREY